MNLKKIFFQRRFIILLMVLNSLLIALEYGQLTNTLYKNGKWIATKTSLEKGVMGAYGFMGTRKALARGRLDLGSWHGFQEVIYKEAIDIHTAAFRFFLEKDSYVVFIFNKNTDQFSGIRISLNNLFKSIYFRCDSNGEFLTRKEINVPNLYPEKWYSCRIYFKKGKANLFINNDLIDQFKVESIGKSYFGFRGSAKSALIDDILIYSKEPNTTVSESFNNFNISSVIPTVISLVILSVLILALTRIRLFQKNQYVSLFNIFIALCLCFIYLADYFIFSTRYPLPTLHNIFTRGKLKDLEGLYWQNASLEFIRKDLDKDYLQQIDKDMLRIVFLGTSQCWGAGAVRESDTFVKVLEQKINLWLKGRGKVQCINCSISGLDSAELYKIYIAKCLKFYPKICVIVLSNNDQDEQAFSINLQNFINLNQSLNIRTIFVLEANSIETNPGPLPLHKVMRAIGEKNGITVIDLHGFLNENYDQGFLWWDVVHLTNFGQQLATGCLFDALRKEVLLAADKI